MRQRQSQSHRELQLRDALQYGANGLDTALDFSTRTGDAALASHLRRCQKEIGKTARKHVQTIHKQITKCRNGLIRGKLTGFQPVDCRDNPIETKPMEKIAKSASKTLAKISDKCLALLANPHMDVCDIGDGPATTALEAGNCIVTSHENAIDDPDNSGGAVPFPTDLIDVEYALGAVCGDGLVNDPGLPSGYFATSFLGPPAEECDGADDDACPGACGAPDGDFPCLCTDSPRLRILEHANGDLDRGWTGLRHDQALLGASYHLDVSDCDGPAGPDTLCTLGPSCALAPHAPCTTDTDCPGGGDFCRKTGLALGPHCHGDLQQPCANGGDCPSAGDFCRKQPHGVPLPLSGGGVSVCAVNVFADDVTGTIDFASGESVYRVRELAVTHLAQGTLNQPCPVCGDPAEPSMRRLRPYGQEVHLRHRDRQGVQRRLRVRGRRSRKLRLPMLLPEQWRRAAAAERLPRRLSRRNERLRPLPRG